MREYFKAFKNQDPTHREYRPYFKPVLSYLEGAWTVPPASGALEESFESDRHFLDASSFADLLQKIAFTSYTGMKDKDENHAYLPHRIMENRNNTPILAQWNYRILCHPIEGDLPTNRLQPVNEMRVGMANGQHLNEYAATRAARFQLNAQNSSDWRSSTYFYEFLDYIMEQVPGVDNYPGNMEDPNFQHFITQTPLNTAFYHRVAKLTGKDAMGTNNIRRGFNDRTVFMAETTNSRIASMRMESCRGRGRQRRCTNQEKRMTYAIPLEIIYLTPLSTWNPYNLHYKGEAKSLLGKSVIANGRNGATPEKAFDGINSKLYYKTPVALFGTSGSNGGGERDPADTTKRGGVYVLDSSGQPVKTVASGIRIFMPRIQDVGIIRQRYPIFPVHGEDSAVWKELNALKEFVLAGGACTQTCNGQGDGSSQNQQGGSSQNRGMRLKLSPSRWSRGVVPHDHRVELSAADVEILQAGGSVIKDTTTDNGHSHNVEIKYWPRQSAYFLFRCDGQERCRDGHQRRLLSDLT